MAGVGCTTVEDVLSGPEPRVMRAIQAGIDKANKEAVSRAQVIQKWMVIPRDFSIPGGEMGPTMKVCQVTIYSYEFAIVIFDFIRLIIVFDQVKRGYVTQEVPALY